MMEAQPSIVPWQSSIVVVLILAGSSHKYLCYTHRGGGLCRLVLGSELEKRELPSMGLWSQDPKPKTLSSPPKSKMSKLLIFLTLIPLLPILITSFSPENPSSRRVLVLLDYLTLKSSHSVFFNSLQSRGFDLDFNLS
uniref:Uncharacterized protein n=1 Tax=Quercus lobata TaxID=97700 RepID=A0A7N2MZ57_QUELO